VTFSAVHTPPLKELDLVQGRGTGGEVDRGNVPRLSQPLTPPPLKELDLVQGRGREERLNRGMLRDFLSRSHPSLKELNLVQGRGTGGEVDRGNVPRLSQPLTPPPLKS